MRAPSSIYRPDPTASGQAPAGGGCASSTGQQQQQSASTNNAANKGPPPQRVAGGQRTALKLTTVPPAPQPPAAAKVAAAGQPNSAQAPPPCQSRWQQAPPSSTGYGSGCGPECEDDATSECSCSAALECQPPGPLPPPPPHPRSLVDLRYSPQHHHPMHHNQHHQPPLYHHHQAQHMHHPGHAAQHHYHQHQQFMTNNHLDSQTSDDCAFINTNHQSQHLNQHPSLQHHNTYHHQTPQHHRHHRTASTGSPSPPPPPPLIRQSTYTVAPDTITDSSIMIGHTHNPSGGGSQAAATSDFIHPATTTTNNHNLQTAERVNGHQGNYGTLPHLGPGHGHGSSSKYQTTCIGPNSSGNHTQSSKQRQSVSFRRSATLGSEDPPTMMENGHHSLKLNATANNNSINIYTAEDRLLLNEEATAGSGCAGTGSGALTLTGIGGKKTNNKAGKKHHTNKQQNNKNNLSSAGRVSSANDAFSTRHTVIPCGESSSPIHGPTSATAAATSVAGLTHLSPIPSATYPPGSPTHAANLNAQGTGSQAGINRYLYPGSLWSFDSPLPPPLPQLAPPTSHRTNSSWMRISSIILAPIGLVIVLFIVVSPLLHYLV